MAVDTKWFRARLTDRRMSQRGLAKQLGLDAAAVSLMLRGRREMKIAEAAAIARLLGVPADEVIQHAGVVLSSRGASVPVAGWVDASVEIHQEPTGLTVPHPSQDLPAQLVAIECRTAGTELDHMDGWILFMAAHTDDHVQAEAVGRLSAVRLRGGIVCLGKPGRSMTRGRWDVATPLGVIRAADVEWAKPVLLVCP